MGRVQLHAHEGISVLEAAHTGHESLVVWLDDLMARFRRLVTGGGLYTGAIVRRREAHWELVAGDTESSGLGPLAEFGRLLPLVPPDALDGYYRNPRLAFTHGLVRRTCPAAAPVGDQFLAMLGMGDSVSTLAQATGGVTMVLFAMSEAGIDVAPADRLLLTRVAAHLEAIFRIRMGGAGPVAILRVDGELRDAEGASSQPHHRTRLREHVKRVEGTRRRAARAQRGAIDVWSALVNGRFALVEDIESPVREYHVYENPEHVWATRALTHREAHVLELSARGMSGKLVGYTLGLSFGSVSAALASAAARTGCGSRNEVVRLAATVLSRTSAPVDCAALTPAEREIVTRLREGWSNGAIAKERGTSENTVANQVGALLRKLGVGSRRAVSTLPIARSDELTDGAPSR